MALASRELHLAAERKLVVGLVESKIFAFAAGGPRAKSLNPDRDEWEETAVGREDLLGVGGDSGAEVDLVN